jgi:hypothetical protein
MQGTSEERRLNGGSGRYRSRFRNKCPKKLEAGHLSMTSLSFFSNKFRT